MSSPVTRADIVRTARSWIGTPYVHQASCKGAGSDCLGLLRGVWRDLFGQEPEQPPPYTPDWAERHRAETLRDAAARHLVEIEIADALPGDVLLFAFKERLPAKHCALLTTAIKDPAPKILHAHENLPVSEVALFDGWRKRVRFAFSFPGIGMNPAPPVPQGQTAAGPDGPPPLEGSPKGGAPVRRN